jgi:hypothetical protein
VVTLLRIEADNDYPDPLFSINKRRSDGVSAGSGADIDTRQTPLPAEKGANLIGLRLPSLEFPFNAYFLSLKAYTKNAGPDWKGSAEIHNKMRQFEVKTDRLTHGLMNFDAEWRCDTVIDLKQKTVAPP